MNILFVINEASPLYKLGGLGDVGGSLPIALNVFDDIDLRLALPYHPDLKLPSSTPIKSVEFKIIYDRRSLNVTIVLTYLPGSNIPVYLFHEPEFLTQPSGALDNYADKYAVFSLAVTTWIAHHTPSWQPHIVHCHDWHTALIPVLLKHQFHRNQEKTIITIHNLAYQGITRAPVAKRLNLPQDACQILTWDAADGDTNILLEGLIHADFITTVSPRYAQEILTSEYGAHLESILQTKKHRLLGILNGIDVDFFNPGQDPFLKSPYTIESAVSGKHTNKTDLITTYGGDSTLPLVSFIGRVDAFQKGIDLIAQYLVAKDSLPPHLFYFLGTGDREHETKLHDLAANHSDVHIFTRFDEPLAHQIYAASDFLLIPSRYEPCGLIQMIAMRYGTLPIAHATGGLFDTITDNQNGFLFKPCELHPLLSRLNDALGTFQDSSQHHRRLQQAMQQNFSWNQSAKQYHQLYHQLLYR